jgi:hypothetical protein
MIGCTFEHLFPLRRCSVCCQAKACTPGASIHPFIHPRCFARACVLMHGPTLPFPRVSTHTRIYILKGSEQSAGTAKPHVVRASEYHSTRKLKKSRSRIHLSNAGSYYCREYEKGFPWAGLDLEAGRQTYSERSEAL